MDENNLNDISQSPLLRRRRIYVEYMDKVDIENRLLAKGDGDGDGSSTSASCPICFEALTVDNTTTLNCSHIFCILCIKEHYLHSMCRRSCPLCREEMNEIRVSNMDEINDIVDFEDDFSKLFFQYRMYLK